MGLTIDSIASTEPDLRAARTLVNNLVSIRKLIVANNTALASTLWNNTAKGSSADHHGTAINIAAAIDTDSLATLMMTNMLLRAAAALASESTAASAYITSDPHIDFGNSYASTGKTVVFMNADGAVRDLYTGLYDWMRKAADVTTAHVGKPYRRVTLMFTPATNDIAIGELKLYTLNEVQKNMFAAVQTSATEPLTVTEGSKVSVDTAGWKALDGNGATAWKTTTATDSERWISIDFGADNLSVPVGLAIKAKTGAAAAIPVGIAVLCHDEVFNPAGTTGRQAVMADINTTGLGITDSGFTDIRFADHEFV